MRPTPIGEEKVTTEAGRNGTDACPIVPECDSFSVERTGIGTDVRTRAQSHVHDATLSLAKRTGIGTDVRTRAPGHPTAP